MNLRTTFRKIVALTAFALILAAGFLSGDISIYLMGMGMGWLSLLLALWASDDVEVPMFEEEVDR